MSRRAGNVRSGLVNAFLPANPFGGLALVIVAIAGKPVTVRAEGNAVFVEAALETSEGLVVSLGMADADGAQGPEVLVDEFQDFIVPFTRVTEQLTDLE